MGRNEGKLVAGMKVLMVEPGKHPYELEIGYTLEEAEREMVRKRGPG